MCVCAMELKKNKLSVDSVESAARKQHVPANALNEVVNTPHSVTLGREEGGFVCRCGGVVWGEKQSKDLVRRHTVAHRVRHRAEWNISAT